MRRHAVVALLAASCVLISGEGRAAIIPGKPLSIAAEDASDRSDNRALANAGCYSNLTKIHIDENNRLDTNVFCTYTLCPNTVFVLGFQDNSGGIVGGDYPLRPRANTLYKCGTSGASSNKCILRGGDFGFAHDDAYPEPFVNSTIQGVTFEAHFSYGAVFFAGGQVSFVDCIFRGMSNIGPVYLNLATSRRRLVQLPIVSKTPSGRILAAVNYKSVLDIKFVGCVFRDNVDPNVGSFPGVVSGITVPGKTHIYLTIRKSLFTNNTYVVQGNSYAIQVDDTITLQSNCFIGNRFVGYGPVQVLNKTALKSSGNYGRSNGNVKCAYADVTNLDFTTTKCVPYEATKCTAFPVAPTRKPTKKPVAPTRKPPTRKPTRKPVAP